MLLEPFANLVAVIPSGIDLVDVGDVPVSQLIRQAPASDANVGELVILADVDVNASEPGEILPVLLDHVYRHLLPPLRIHRLIPYEASLLELEGKLGVQWTMLRGRCERR